MSSLGSSYINPADDTTKAMATPKGAVQQSGSDVPVDVALVDVGSCLYLVRAKGLKLHCGFLHG